MAVPECCERLEPSFWTLPAMSSRRVDWRSMPFGGSTSVVWMKGYIKSGLMLPVMSTTHSPGRKGPLTFSAHRKVHHLIRSWLWMKHWPRMPTSWQSSSRKTFVTSPGPALLEV